MPVRRRLQAVRERTVDPVSAFRWSAGGTGLDHMLGKPCFQTEDEARRAWQRVRRDVWARAHRFTVPPSAEHFDGLTMKGLKFVRWHWDHVESFDLTGALAALAEDHAALLAFEATRRARAIDDYLAMLRADLRTIEQTARALSANRGPHYLRLYPGHLNTAARYGDGDAQTTGEDVNAD